MRSNFNSRCRIEINMESCGDLQDNDHSTDDQRHIKGPVCVCVCEKGRELKNEWE